MILIALVALLVIAALIAGLVAGGTVIAIIILIIGFIALIVKLATRKESETNVTINIPTEKDEIFSSRGMNERGAIFISKQKAIENKDTSIFISYIEESDRKVSPEIRTLMDRAYIALSGGQFDDSFLQFDRVLDKEPRFAPAYIGKLLSKIKVRDVNNLAFVEFNFSKHPFWISACRFATELELSQYKNLFMQQKENIYNCYSQYLETLGSQKKLITEENEGIYERVIDYLSDFNDEDLKRLSDIYAEQLESERKYARKISIIRILSVVGCIILILLVLFILKP